MIIFGEDAMISTNCDFSDFVAAIKDKPYQDIIYLADQEATEAERLYYRSGAYGDKEKICGEKYAGILKDLVTYLRYDVRFKNSKNEYNELYASILESAQANARIAIGSPTAG
jgi:hypothetical protein